MLFMDKKIIIGIIIIIVLSIGAISLTKVSQNDEKEVKNVESTQRIPQSFTVDLHESVGFKESP